MVNPFWTVVFPTISRILSAATGASEEILIRAMEEEDRGRLENPPQDEELAMNWDDIVRTVADNHGVKISISVEDLVVQHSSPPHDSTLDGAFKMLTSLFQQEGRKPIAVLAGLSKYQFLALSSLGLFDLSEDYLMPDITGYLKMDKRFYSEELQQSSNSSFINIGDHYIDDISYPGSFGFHGILKASIPQLERFSPFERPNHLSQFRDQVLGLANPAPVAPDAVVTNPVELSDVIYQFERTSHKQEGL